MNVGHGTGPETAAFLKSNKADLPVYLDTKSAFLHAFGAFGLPLNDLDRPKGERSPAPVARSDGTRRTLVSYFKALKNSGAVIYRVGTGVSPR